MVFIIIVCKQQSYFIQELLVDQRFQDIYHQSFASPLEAEKHYMRSTHPAADITSTVTDVDNQLTLTEAVDSCQRIMAQLSDSEDQLRLLSDLFRIILAS